MGVIKKKTVTRGTEGGLKYICDVCAADITSTVRIHCADSACSDYDSCVPCFGKGEFKQPHDPSTHSFSVVEQHSIPIFAEDWGADEELLMLEGAETYGLGSWADISDHIGGFRNKDEVSQHYIDTFLDSPNFPLPALADPKDMSLLEKIPRDEFQARKKRRIEDRKEAAKNQPPAPPKQKPTASVPSCHEVQGYMPGRLEFETEFANEAEEAVMHMQFDPGDGINPATKQLESEMELKLAVMDIYNSKLTMRALRKRTIFEHTLLEYRKNAANEKKRTKDEREQLGRCKVFTRVMNNKDWHDLSTGLEKEYNLRLAIGQLQDWRRHGLSDLRIGEKYETEKAQRASRPPPGAHIDRLPGSRPPKAQAQAEVPAETQAMVAQELVERLKPKPKTAEDRKNGKAPQLTNGTTATPTKLSTYSPAPIPGMAPLKLDRESITDVHLLSAEEKELCAVLRFTPKAYLAHKDAIMREAIKAGGALKRKNIREISKIDSAKASRLFEFFCRSGWIQKG